MVRPQCIMGFLAITHRQMSFSWIDNVTLPFYRNQRQNQGHRFGWKHRDLWNWTSKEIGSVSSLLTTLVIVPDTGKRSDVKVIISTNCKIRNSLLTTSFLSLRKPWSCKFSYPDATYSLVHLIKGVTENEFNFKTITAINDFAVQSIILPRVSLKGRLLWNPNEPGTTILNSWNWYLRRKGTSYALANCKGDLPGLMSSRWSRGVF